MTKSRYSQDQLIFLKCGYQLLPVRYLTLLFNFVFRVDKTEAQIHSCLSNHKIRCGRKGAERLINHRRLLTPEQSAFVRREYRNHTQEELAVMVNDRFGTQLTGSQIRSYVRNHKIRSGRTGCFSKGHKPWNNGTKGKGICKPNSGSFKKGEIPANTKPLGHERVCSKDGYILIKVKEKNPYTGAATRYKHKHVHLYEQKNGPVPDGMVIIFKDADKRNFDPENLIAVSRSELVRLNQIRYKELPAELKPSTLAMIQLKVKTFEKIKEQKAV